MNFESQFVHCDYDYDYKVWPEVYLLLINLLICLLTANYQLYKVLNHVLNHKMMKNDFDFYLEDITESSLNTDRIKELLHFERKKSMGKNKKQGQTKKTSRWKTQYHEGILTRLWHFLILILRMNQTLTVNLILNKSFKSNIDE